MRRIVGECMNININNQHQSRIHCSMRQRIVGECRTINNCAHGAAALCHSKLQQNYFVQIHSGTKCKYKYTDVQSANTNTNCKMYSRAMARSHQCATFYTVGNRCAKASNMGDGRTIQIQCCLCPRRHRERVLTSVTLLPRVLKLPLSSVNKTGERIRRGHGR